jgi:hypothetical protein
MSKVPKDTGKQYHTQCTGIALETANKHTQAEDITLFSSGFCPFVQRVWVALEYLHIPYKVRCIFLMYWTTSLPKFLQYRESP